MVRLQFLAGQTAPTGSGVGVKTKVKIAKTAALVAKAEEAVKEAQAAHRLAFREACAALFTEYGLCLEADGSMGAHLTICELGGDAFSVNGLPQ